MHVLSMQEKLRRSWQDKERRRLDALESVWRQRQQAHDAVHQADLAKERAALAADCRQAREVGVASAAVPICCLERKGLQGHAAEQQVICV